MADVLVKVSCRLVDAGEDLETAAFKIGEGGASRDSMHVSLFQTNSVLCSEIDNQKIIYSILLETKIPLKK